MTQENDENSSRSFIDFSALKTAVVNSETEKVRDMLSGQNIQALEKDYLLDLARMNNNDEIIKLIEQK